MKQKIAEKEDKDEALKQINKGHKQIRDKVKK